VCMWVNMYHQFTKRQGSIEIDGVSCVGSTAFTGRWIARGL
jgi:hypothetical protein